MLEGSVRREAGGIRLTAQLIDGTTGTHIWAKRYDRSLADIFAVQDDLTESIFAAVVPELGETERARARSKRPESLTAWDCYQRGLWHLYRRTRDDVAEAERARRARPTASFPFWQSASAELLAPYRFAGTTGHKRGFRRPEQSREVSDAGRTPGAERALWPVALSAPSRCCPGEPAAGLGVLRDLSASGLMRRAEFLLRSKPGTPFGHEPLLPTPNSALATYA